MVATVAVAPAIRLPKLGALIVPNRAPFLGARAFRASVSVQEAALLRWNQVYETVRPHQALGYKTSYRFYQDWLTTHSPGKEALSDVF